MQQNLFNILFTIILSFVLVPIFAQNGTNPFDLNPRIKEKVTDVTPVSTTDQNKATSNSEQAEQQRNNPFDLNKKTNEATDKKETAVTTPSDPETIIEEDSKNPFELKKEKDEVIEKKSVVSDSASKKSAISTPNADNPFDLVADPSTQTSISSEKTPVSSPEIKKNPTSPKIAKTILPVAGNNKSYQQFLFRVVLFMLILLTLLITLFRSFLVKTYQAFLNDNILSIIYRERGSILISPYTILYLMFLINAGIFLFLLSEYYQVYIIEGRFLSLLASIGLVFVIFMLKHLILELLAFIFPIKKEVKLYNFTIIVFGIIVGMLLVPVNILIAYAPQGLTSSLVYVAIGLIGLVYLFRSLRGLFIGNRFLLFHKFHFLLYICTVEIAPIIVFLKLLST